MKAKFFLGLLLVIFFALTTYVFLAYYYSAPKNIQVEHQLVLSQKKSIEKEESWLFSLLKSQKNYTYPATEIKVNVDFKSLAERSESTKLVIKDLDDYKFFCLNEVLKEENVEYAYEQAGNLANIIIYLPEGLKRKQIIQDLRHYEIEYIAQ